MKKSLPVLILHGPNFNMLGKREPKVYGKATLKDLENFCKTIAREQKLTIEFKQSNLEGELITWVQEAKKKNSAIIINAGGYSHSSVALLDALTIANKPVIEVHISNIYAREEFRHKSLISKVAKGVLCGLGLEGYRYALMAVQTILNPSKDKR